MTEQNTEPALPGVEPAKTGGKVDDGRAPDGTFTKGHAFGRAGRPQGSRNRASLAIEVLLDGEADKLTRKAVELALGGDTTALRLCLERLCPARKDRPIMVALPPIKSPQDAVTLMGAVLDEMSAGEITPSEAAAVAGVVETYRRTVELSDVLPRLAALEARASK